MVEKEGVGGGTILAAFRSIGLRRVGFWLEEFLEIYGKFSPVNCGYGASHLGVVLFVNVDSDCASCCSDLH